jgi:hypothetical protein
MNSSAFGDDIKDLPTSPASPPAQPGQLEYFHNMLQAVQRGSVDPEEHEEIIKSGKFVNLKKSGLITLMFILLNLGIVEKGAGLVFENALFRRGVISIIFFLIVFVILRFM